MLNLGRNLRAELFFGHSKIVAALKIHPECRARAEVPRKAKHRVWRDIALAVEDVGEAPRGDADRQGEAVD